MIKRKCAVVCVAGIIFFSGCASFKEKAKGLLGVSTKTLEEHRPSATSRTVAMDHDSCYSRVKTTLDAMRSYIYAQDGKKTMIAIYVSEQDTTPVGIFLKPVDSSSTQVEVSSPSSEARDMIAARLFAALDEPPLAPKLQEREDSNDAAAP